MLNFTHLRPTIVVLLLFTLLFGGLYPALGTLMAQGIFAAQANGSLLGKHGSSLIGQNFTAPRYFWSRLSATSPMPYNAASSSGSNFGAANPALLEAVKGRIADLRTADPDNRQPIPADLVTASASGLDPHISPAAAEYQAARVARLRGLSLSRVQRLVSQHTEGRQWGIFGEPRVNVLELNLALDAAR